MNQPSNLVRRTVNGRDYDAVVLKFGGSTAEIWPGLGGNCVRWSTETAGDIVWSPPLDELVGRATRGGIPVLFPFPNRIRAGRYSFAGRSYQLPRNDSTGVNAIHGFAPRAPWQVGNFTTTSAELSFRIRRDDPANAASWPGDLELVLHWQLELNLLLCRAIVTNHGTNAAPFGLGFHPYFRVTGPDDRICVPAAQRWELVEGLPTGNQLAVANNYDLRQPQAVGNVQLDDVYSGLTKGPDRLRSIGKLLRTDGVAVSIQATNEFSEAVVFTPPHGKAVCLEPYTCPTDAINLTARGMSVGWSELDAGAAWSGEVQYELSRG